MMWTDLLTFCLALLLAYVYLGYPVLVCLCARLFPRPHQVDEGYRPRVSLLISAYNEAAVIGAKIENSLALDYPPELLEIIVVSDCSSDATDQEVLRFADRGVRLVRSAERRGKTSALNRAMEGVAGEVVVFSDANALYHAEALRMLVRNLADPTVGYVVGHARYAEEKASAAGSSENTYWNLEVLLKGWESRFSSVVGGDGAIYAIRRELYLPLLETDINDFVNPLQIVAAGYRGIFEPAAWCVERPAGEFGKEFARKLRIVNRSFSGFLRVPRACNPLANGRFAWQLVSHKLLRWFSPYILGFLLLAMVLDALLSPVTALDQLSLMAVVGILGLALVGWLLKSCSRTPTLFWLPYYFVLMNLASALGILKRLQGTTITTWSTVRENEAVKVPQQVARLVCCLGGGALFLAGFGLVRTHLPLDVLAVVLMLCLLHTFVGYPYLLFGLQRFLRKVPQRDETFRPTVTLLIVAYNEAGVIEAKLRNSLELAYPPDRLRIVVASDGSRDATDRIVAGFAGQGVELISFAQNRGKISALNDAMQQLGSEIVVLSDANVFYDPKAIQKLVRNFADPRVGLVSGKVILRNHTVSYGEAEESYYSIEHEVQECEGRLGTLIGADGAMYALRRALFIPPRRDTILDDLVIALTVGRQGFLVLHEREALGYEDNHLELHGEYRRKVRIIAGGFQCLLRPGLLPKLSQPMFLFCFVSHKVLRWLSGLLLVCLFGVLLQLQLDHGPPIFGFLLAGLVLAVLLALLVQRFPALKGVRLANFCHYFFMLMAASLVGCFLGITGRQKVTWRGGTT